LQTVLRDDHGAMVFFLSPLKVQSFALQNTKALAVFNFGVSVNGQACLARLMEAFPLSKVVCERFLNQYVSNNSFVVCVRMAGAWPTE
jgi:hypothetical protein